LNNYIDVNKQAYEQLANEGYYDKILMEYDDITCYLCNRVYEQYRTMNKGNNPLNLLELGPGSGRSLYYFSNIYNINTTAIELSDKMAKKVSDMVKRVGMIVGDVKDIDKLLDHQYDIIYASAFIHLFPKNDASIVLQNACKWLKDSGIIYLSTTINQELKEGVFPKLYSQSKVRRYRVLYTEPEFKKLITISNLDIVDEWKRDDTNRNRKWLNIICRKKGNQNVQ
jgi:cyclopropane fatty-acyl-phospholipid synthase-like methyltransferase